MDILLKEIEFYKEKSDSKAIIVAAWSLVQIPGGISGGKVPEIFWLYNVFKAVKQSTMALKDHVHGIRSHASS